MTYPVTTDVLRTDTFDSWASKTNQNRASLLYTQEKLGTIDNLATTATNIVDAVNEIKTSNTSVATTIGDLTTVDDAVEGADVATTIQNLYDTLNTTLSAEIDADVAALKTELSTLITTNVNTLNTSIGNSDTGVASNTALINQVITTIGLNSDGTLSDNSRFASLSAEIDTDVAVLKTELQGVITANVNTLNVSIGNSNAGIAANTTLINQMISTLGLNSDGTMVDGAQFANASNVAAENLSQDTIIAALDAQITNINNQLGIIGSNLDDGDANTNANSVAIAAKLEVDEVLSGNSFINVTPSSDPRQVTLTHVTLPSNPSLSSLTEQTVFSGITVDGAGHVTGLATRELGNMSTKNQYVSSAPPSSSDGSNGDVWYRI